MTVRSQHSYKLPSLYVDKLRRRSTGGEVAVSSSAQCHPMLRVRSCRSVTLAKEQINGSSH